MDGDDGNDVEVGDVDHILNVVDNDGNVPSNHIVNIKEAFMAAPGYEFVSADFSCMVLYKLCCLLNMNPLYTFFVFLTIF